MQPKSIILFFYGYILFFRRQLPSVQSLYPITPLWIAGNILSREAFKVITSFFTRIKAQGFKGDFGSLDFSS